MPAIIQLVKPTELLALAAIFRTVDFAAKLEQADQGVGMLGVRFTDEPADPEARFIFYDQLMREVPKKREG